MKLKPYLPENTFRLSEDSLPQEHFHTDQFRKDYGMEKRCWLVCHSIN